QRDGPRVVDAAAGGRADEPDRGGAGVAVAADRPGLEDGAVADDGRRTAGGEDGAAMGGPDVGDRRGGAGPVVAADRLVPAEHGAGYLQNVPPGCDDADRDGAARGRGGGEAVRVVEAPAAGDGAVVGEHTVGNRSAAAEFHVDGPALGPPSPEAAVPAVRLVTGEQGVAD